MFRQKAIWLLLAAYVTVLAAMTGLPWGDLPNHLTRITIIGELLSSPSSYYHQHYSSTGCLFRTYSGTFWQPAPVAFFPWKLMVCCGQSSRF